MAESDPMKNITDFMLPVVKANLDGKGYNNNDKKLVDPKIRRDLYIRIMAPAWKRYHLSMAVEVAKAKLERESHS